MKLYTNSELLALFERHIAQMPTPEEPQRLYAPIKYGLEMGGKRIRPTLLMLAYNLYKEDIERAVMPAMAMMPSARSAMALVWRFWNSRPWMARFGVALKAAGS